MAAIPPGIQMQPPDGGGFVDPSARPKWSVIAIVGFVLSFLFVLAPLGVVLGVVGIFRTTGRRRRGMGLAIAAIPIGLVVSAISVTVVVAVWAFAQIVTFAPETMRFLEASRTRIPVVASEVYADCSKRFQLQVSDEGFQAWALQVADKHGTMQDLDPRSLDVVPSDDGRFHVKLTGKFVNGPAGIRITVGMNGITPEIDDIEVDGVSPITPSGGE